MPSTYSFHFKLALLAPLFITLLPHGILAQNSSAGPDRFSNVHMTEPTTDVDLFGFYNPGTEDGDVVGNGFCWDILRGDGTPIVNAFTTLNASVELMEGIAEAAGDDVVDIIALAINDTTCATYYWPSNLALGQYHIRVNSSVNTSHSDGSFDIQQITTRAVNMNVSASGPIGCGSGRTPEQFAHITSPFSQSYTSLYLRGPNAGLNVPIDPNITKPPLNVEWIYRDTRNAFSAGISNLTIQILDNTNGNPVGPLQTPSSDDLVSVLPLYALDFDKIPMTINGSYKIRIQYNNQLQDGAVAPGGLVTLTSAEFNIVGEDKNCSAPDASGSSNVPGSSPSPGSSKHSNGSTITMAYMRLLCAFVAIAFGYVNAL